MNEHYAKLVDALEEREEAFTKLLEADRKFSELNDVRTLSALFKECVSEEEYMRLKEELNEYHTIDPKTDDAFKEREKAFNNLGDAVMKFRSLVKPFKGGDEDTK